VKLLSVHICRAATYVTASNREAASGFFFALASAYRAQRGAKWDELGAPHVGCWWACDRDLLGMASRRVSERHAPEIYREIHNIEILVREHLRKGFSETPVCARAEVTAFLDDLRVIGDAVTSANRPGNMVEYARIYSLMDRKRRQTASRRGEVFYEQLRNNLLLSPL